MQRQDMPDGNDPPRPVRPAAVVKGKAKAPIKILPLRGAVQRGRRRRVRTLMTPSRYRTVPLPARFSTSDESDEESDTPSRGSLESMDSADELGSLSDSEDSGSDFNNVNEPYSPPALEGEAPEDKILVTKPPAKNSADLEEPKESGETPKEQEQDENEKQTEKSPEDIADKKAVLEQELRIPDKGLEKKKDRKVILRFRKSPAEIADKEAVLKKELRILDRSEKRKHLNDEESDTLSRGSLESTDRADELGSLSVSEDSGSDFNSENEPYSPPALEGEAPEDKILVTKPPAKKAVKVILRFRKSPAEIADKEAVLKKELRILDRSEKRKHLNDEESDTPSRGSLESTDRADELGSLSVSEDSGSDFNSENEPYSPPALEGEAPEDKILVTKPLAKKAVKVILRFRKSPAEIADKEAVLKKELRFLDRSEKRKHLNDEESDTPSRGSLESMDRADELGSLSVSEDSGSDFNSKNEPYSPPALEGEAPEDKILVTKPPAKKAVKVILRFRKSPAEIADKEAVLKKELRFLDRSEKRKHLNQGCSSASKKGAKVPSEPGPAEVSEAGPAQEPAQEPAEKRLKESE